MATLSRISAFPFLPGSARPRVTSFRASAAPRTRYLVIKAARVDDASYAAKKSELPYGVLATFGIGLLAASVVNVQSVVAEVDLDLGQEVFEGNCAACHAGGGNSIITDHTLTKDAMEKYLKGGYNITSIVYQIQNGKGAMPAWSNSLDDDEIDSVAQYVYNRASSGW